VTVGPTKKAARPEVASATGSPGSRPCGVIAERGVPVLVQLTRYRAALSGGPAPDPNINSQMRGGMLALEISVTSGSVEDWVFRAPSPSARRAGHVRVGAEGRQENRCQRQRATVPPFCRCRSVRLGPGTVLVIYWPLRRSRLSCASMIGAAYHRRRREMRCREFFGGAAKGGTASRSWY